MRDLERRAAKEEWGGVLRGYRVLYPGGDVSYVAVRTNGRVQTRRGNWYYKEQYYRVEDGEIGLTRRGKKFHAISSDVMIQEALSSLGVPAEEQTPDRFLDLVERRTAVIGRSR